MKYFDCTRDCKYCVAKLCEKRGNYISGSTVEMRLSKRLHFKPLTKMS